MSDEKLIADLGEALSETTVEVYVSGGVVQEVWAPDGVVVLVKDFDCDGADEATLDTDPVTGDKCVIATWRGNCRKE